LEVDPALPRSVLFKSALRLKNQRLDTVIYEASFAVKSFLNTL